MEFYTQNGWAGKHAAERLSAKEVAERLRKYIKEDKDLNRCKWSVTSELSGWQYYLRVSLMAAPFDPFSEEYKQKHPERATRGYSEHGDLNNYTTEECQKAMRKVKDFVISYNYDDSDGMIDYFDRHIYDSYYIGKHDKPFIRIEEKTKAARTAAAKPTERPAKGVQILDYSEKALAVIGDTMAIKDTLKQLGGRFNARLTCGAGWVFSKAKRAELEAALL